MKSLLIALAAILPLTALAQINLHDELSAVLPPGNHTGVMPPGKGECAVTVDTSHGTDYSVGITPRTLAYDFEEGQSSECMYTDACFVVKGFSKTLDYVKAKEGVYAKTLLPNKHGFGYSTRMTLILTYLPEGLLVEIEERTGLLGGSAVSSACLIN